MLKIAEEKDVHNKLYSGDIIDYITNAKMGYDFLVAADVFVYIGDLSEIFQLVRSKNMKPGKLVFSTEHTEKMAIISSRQFLFALEKLYLKSLRSIWFKSLLLYY